jgi:hypothetical protein
MSSQINDFTTNVPILTDCCMAVTLRAANIAPKGQALCKRLEILTCDWPKSSNRSQPLYTYMESRFGGMIFLTKKCMLWLFIYFVLFYIQVFAMQTLPPLNQGERS